MTDIVNGLWIGDGLGLLERLSITSFLRQGHVYHLYCYGELSGVPAGAVIHDAREIFPESAIFCYEQGPGKGSVAAFSDVFRYKLLWEKGGWWVDTDVVCLKPFDFSAPMVFASTKTRQGSTQVASAVIKLPAGHEVARLCLEAARQRNPNTLKWGEIGPRLLDQVVRASGLTSFIQPVEVFFPIPFWEWALALCDDTDERRPVISEVTYGVHLCHEMWRRGKLDRLTSFPRGSICDDLMKRYAVDFG